MRSGSSKFNIEAAQRAAEWLETNNQHVHAEAVRRLCRSNASLIETCSRLHQDNADLRAAETVA